MKKPKKKRDKRKKPYRTAIVCPRCAIEHEGSAATCCGVRISIF